MSPSASDTPDLSKPAAPVQREAKAQSFQRGRGRGTVKFLGARRGAGVLVTAAGETAVRYQIDLYQNGLSRNGSGALEADAFPATLPGEDARLRLSDGSEVDVLSLTIDEDGATFETRGELPA